MIYIKNMADRSQLYPRFASFAGAVKELKKQILEDLKPELQVASW